MSHSLKFPQQVLLMILALVAMGSHGLALGQVFDQFRLVGNHNGVTTGYVTSISFDHEINQATLHYLNVAGISDEFTVDLTPSATIAAGLPVFLPPADFLQPPPPALDLTDVEFLQGQIAASEDRTTPAHWFRLTHYDNRWSGVFRVDNRIYSIDRYTDEDTIAVRAAVHGDQVFRPDQRVKVSAVIDENYVQSDASGDRIGMDNVGHLFALESVHVMDGLLSDSLGITLLLEHLIYQPSASITDTTSQANILAATETWLDNHADAFGLTDNFATFYFRGSLSQTGSGTGQPTETNDHIAVINNTPGYQFVTANAFGRLLNLAAEPDTIQQHLSTDNPIFTRVLWSDNHKRYLDDNALPEQFVQRISADAPEVGDPPQEESAGELDEGLIIAELPESGGIIADDEPAANFIETGGSGVFAPGVLVLWLSLMQYRRRHAFNRQ